MSHQLGYGKTETRSGGTTTSTPDPALSAISQQIFQGIAPVGEEFLSQLMEGLVTGGVGARIPVIQRAVESSKAATAKTMGSIDEELAVMGLAGTPWGEKVRSGALMGGEQVTAGIPTQMTSQLMEQVVNMIMGLTGTAVGGLGQARTDVGTTKGKTDAFQTSGGSAMNCCFIFAASEGWLPWSVRAYRDYKMGVRNRRGYYWLADRLVPLMRKHRSVLLAVRWGMVRPMTEYGRYFFRLRLKGVVFAPVTAFWLLTYAVLGLRGKYRRRGTKEVV